MAFTIIIPATNLSELQDRIAKMGRKAAKLGLPAPTISIGAYSTKTSVNKITKVEFSKSFVEVTVDGEKPSISGWEFAAKLEPISEGKNLVLTLPGVDFVPEKYRSAEMNCDHCGYNRQRLQTFVLRNTTDGGYIQVGRNCLGDYFPGVSAEILAQRAEYELSLADDLSGLKGDTYTGGYREVYDTLDLLQTAAGVIRCCGYISRQKASESFGLDATGYTVRRLLQSKIEFEKFVETYPEFLVDQDKDKVLAEAALAWGKTVEGDGEYIYNLRTLANEKTVNVPGIGTLASLILAYQKATQEKIEKTLKPVSNYVGTVGGKLPLSKVVCTHVHAFDGGFGVSFINRFVDEAGNVIVWKTGTFDGTQGQTYTITGTIKTQEEYRGEKQTTLSRCKVQEVN